MSTQVFKTSLVFLSLLSQILLPNAAMAQTRGIVDYSLQWVSAPQTYTYVFSGIVTCSGKPCADAQVEVDLDSPAQGILHESSLAGADGRYLMQIQVVGVPEQAATWKLTTSGLSRANDPVEVEGRVILMQDQTTVIVERPLMIG